MSPAFCFSTSRPQGVDVELRKDMWDTVAELKASGVTIILTTHYIEEAEAIADRIGVINGGELLLVEDKDRLMVRLGKKRIEVLLSAPVDRVPAALAAHDLTLAGDRDTLVYEYDTQAERTGITQLLNDVAAAGLVLRDVKTRESSLEEIFVDLVSEGRP